MKISKKSINGGEIIAAAYQARDGSAKSESSGIKAKMAWQHSGIINISKSRWRKASAKASAS